MNKVKTHGMTQSRVYNIWAMMRQRCTNPNAANYVNYGGRGIKCCESWAKFSAFYADMGDPPEGEFSLDRIDMHGDYTPENCRWADKYAQANNRRNNVQITVEGVTHTLAEWARKTGLSRDQIRHRINNMGMTPEAALQADRMSWVQRQVQRTNLDGSDVQLFDSVASAAKASGCKRESLWAHLQRQKKPDFMGYCWAYAESLR
jgi:hypothetical protein